MTLVVGDAARVLSTVAKNSVDLVVTSPPYWTAIEYETASPSSTGSYRDYIASLLDVWIQCFRVLRPNGKLAINAPIMPIPKSIIGSQHTRHLKNINNDIEASILRDTRFLRYSLFVWQKQTSKLIFGSYPSPGNILECNTIEFISVYVKPGKPSRRPESVKEANALSREEWIDLTQQVWFMYPEDVKRGAGHPAPFPEKLPARLIRLYTFGACEGFEGDTILDPFCGGGTTCIAAKKMGRRFFGIDISEKYISIARRRLAEAEEGDAPLLLIGRARYPGKDELRRASRSVGSSGKSAEKKHKRSTYGRRGKETR
jgi:DNA modification methylase